MNIMVYHIFLIVNFIVKDKYKSFINFLNPFDDTDYEVTPDKKCIQDLFFEIRDSNHFHKFGFVEDSDEYEIIIEQKPYRNQGNIENDYMKFIKDILVPLTTKITYCSIQRYGCFEPTIYTDYQLRKI
jgi:hypothetical protein